MPEHPNLLVTRTLSRAHSLAGLRVGYAVLPEATADDLNVWSFEHLLLGGVSDGVARRSRIPVLLVP